MSCSVKHLILYFTTLNSNDKWILMQSLSNYATHSMDTKTFKVEGFMKSEQLNP